MILTNDTILPYKLLETLEAPANKLVNVFNHSSIHKSWTAAGRQVPVFIQCLSGNYVLVFPSSRPVTVDYA